MSECGIQMDKNRVSMKMLCLHKMKKEGKQVDWFIS